MPATLPTPVAAVLGLVPTALDSARKLPVKVVQVPVLAVSSALTVLGTVQTEYDALVARGERLVAQLRGELVEDELDPAFVAGEDLIDGTPMESDEQVLAGPSLTVVEEPVQDYEATVTDLLDKASKRSTKTLVADVLDDVPVETPAHDELPLPDYDHMTLGSLRGRLRSLTVDDLMRIRSYESSHAHRLPVITLLDNRIASLATNPDAEPSPGGEPPVPPAAAAPKQVAKKAPAKKAAATKVRKS